MALGRDLEATVENIRAFEKAYRNLGAGDDPATDEQIMDLHAEAGAGLAHVKRVVPEDAEDAEGLAGAFDVVEIEEEDFLIE